MPATLAAGVAARAIDDPGVLFLVLRLLTSVSVLVALAWAAWQACESAGQAAAAVCLTLLSYAFVAHGVEFRYDAAILLGLLAAFGLIVRARDADFLLLGGAAAFVAAHHVKGLLLGAAVLAFGVVRSAGDRRRLVRLAAGAGVVGAAWLALAAACGILPDAPTRWPVEGWPHQLLGLQRNTRLGSWLQPMGLPALRSLDSAVKPQLT